MRTERNIQTTATHTAGHRTSTARKMCTHPITCREAPTAAKEKCGKKEKGNFSRYVAAALCGMFAGAVIFGGALKFAGYGTRYDNSAVEQKSGSASTVSTDGVTSSGMNTVDIVKKAGPAVVGITTVSTTMSFWGQQESQGSGSGFIIKENGYIVTNQHVIAGAKKITVRLSNGDEYDASLIGADSKTDLAVIKIDVTGLPPLKSVNPQSLK